MDNENIEKIIIEKDSINFNSITLRQKIAQMIMIRADSEENTALLKLNIGGIFLDKQKSAEEYADLIRQYNKNSEIRLFIATDLEGNWNPFADFKEFPKFSDIKNNEEAGRAGEGHGELLKELGFNMNFAPVSEFEDRIYGGRAFSGSREEVKSKLKAYIEGLQENVLGVCKHYPGKGMIKNLHLEKDEQNISTKDLELFEYCIKNNITGIMIGHQIVNGELNSEGKPSSISKEIIESIPENILIISDEINMLGLKSFYTDKREMYRDLINAGNNLIPDFKLDKQSAYKLILELEQDVRNGKIEEEKVSTYDSEVNHTKNS